MPRRDFAERLAALAEVAPDGFRTSEGVEEAVRSACARHPDLATFHELGESEEGRPVYAVVLGRGEHAVSLIAGNHADEPVGPETLRLLILEGLARRESLGDLFEAFRFVIVPHTNPDGEARNQTWTGAWPSLGAYLRHAVREQPGRDVEFGFPNLRRENRLTADFLRHHAPFVLHVSLHGMAFSEGAFLLIERRWGFRSGHLRAGFRAAAEAAGLGLHDHNRLGEKGFFYLGPGFNTTPEGAMMRLFFRARGDEASAARFLDSSMEFVRSLGGDPLCLVTELPLFVLPPSATPAVPSRYLAFKEQVAEWKLRLERGEGEAVQEALASWDVSPLPLRTAVRLQLRTLGLALEQVRGEGAVEAE